MLLRMGLPLLLATMIAQPAFATVSQATAIRRACLAINAKYGPHSVDCRRLNATLSGEHWVVQRPMPKGPPTIGGGFGASVASKSGRVEGVWVME